jgi:hypothetical protein
MQTQITKTERKLQEIVKKQLKDKDDGTPVYSILTPKNRKYVTRIVDNADLRLGHYTLAAIAKQIGIDIALMKEGSGQCVVFLNCAKTSFKMFFSPKSMMYYKSEQKLDPEAIHGVARSIMSGGKGDWDEELEKVLLKRLKH